ncbi:hypothetical protein BDZ91DRAFT_708404 [Kalaharituber pfeilii]|nr:hypothetical protein BDZ91DRAFT_708404 [Kalaharituber pfeilii]
MPDNEPPLEIPGFYYDPERQKYFRILPDHLAPRDGSFYTRNTVKSLKAEEKSKALEETERQLEQFRAHFRHRADPFLRATLFRELGTASQQCVLEAARETYARSLGRERSIESPRGGAGVRCFVTMPGLLEGALNHDNVAENEHMSVITGCGSSKGDISVISLAIDKKTGRLKRLGGRSLLIHLHERITSLSLSQSGYLLATSLGGHTPPVACIFKPRLVPLDDIEPEFLSPFANSIWSSTSSTTSLNLTEFAFGTSNGVCTVTLCPHGHVNTQINVESDVFAVEYMETAVPSGSTIDFPSRTGSTLISGARDGMIRIFDPRSMQTNGANRTPQTRINHGSIVSHIRPLNPYLVLAKGPQKCAMYDLRNSYVPKIHTVGAPSPALAVYDDLCDPQGYRVDEGWDVNARGDLMVGLVKGVRAGGEWRDEEIGIWSTVTGKRLRFGKRETVGKVVDRKRKREFQGGRRRGGGSRNTEDENENERAERKERWLTGKHSKFVKFVNVPGVGEEVWATNGDCIERFGFGSA